MDTNPVVLTLQRQQANALVLWLNYKKFHWLTYGPTFRDLHTLLEEQGDKVYESIDEFAERALMIDGKPLGDPDTYLAASAVRPSQGDKTVRQMLEEALAGHEVVIGQLHEDAETAAKAGDIGTADLYTRLVQEHQKSRWFLKEALRGGTGLGW